MGQRAALVPLTLTIQTVAETFWPVLTSYVGITAPGVKTQANLNTGRTLSRISMGQLTLGSSMVERKTNQRGQVSLLINTQIKEGKQSACCHLKTGSAPIFDISQWIEECSSIWQVVCG